MMFSEDYDNLEVKYSDLMFNTHTAQYSCLNCGKDFSTISRFGETEYGEPIKYSYT